MTIRYCTPEWLDESASLYRQTDRFENALKKVTTKIFYRVIAEPAWGIENDLHWCLDIAFREDHSRIRKDHAPENFGILKHMAINMIKKEKSLKAGIQAKRLKAAWDHDYLFKILTP